MINLNSLQVFSCIIVILIQVYRFKEQYCWNIIKGYFNMLTVQVYLLTIFNEIDQIQQYLGYSLQSEYTKFDLFRRLRTILFILSLSIYIGIVFLIIFLKNLHHQKRRIGQKILISLQSLLQTILFQFLFLSSALFIKFFNRTMPFLEILQIVYIRGLLLFSAISSMPPIMQVLLEIPLINFSQSLKNLRQPFIRDIKFKTVLQMKHIHTDEEMAKLTTDQDQMIIFEDLDDNTDSKYCDKIKQSIINYLQTTWNAVKLFGRSINLIYNTIQLLLAIVLIFGFICIFIQIADPNNDILSKLNAVNFFSSQLEDKNSKINQVQFKLIEVAAIAIFKFIFILLMYFSTNDRIQYSKNKELIDDVTNLTVIIRRNLLNFTLIALLTTLYPNLTFTINNSNCFKEITFHYGKLFQMGKEINMNDNHCPTTIIYLITLEVFDGQITTIIGLLILLLYIFTAFYILCVKRKIKNITEL